MPADYQRLSRLLSLSAGNRQITDVGAATTDFLSDGGLVLASDLDIRGGDIQSTTGALTVTTGSGNLIFNPAGVITASKAVHGIDGTASAPALTFTGDTDTGLYRSGANTLDVSLGGTRRLGYSAGAFQFKEATTLSSTGTLTLNAFTLGGTITGGGNTITAVALTSVSGFTASGNLDIGAHDLRAATITADGLAAGRVVFSGTDGLLAEEAGFEYNSSTNVLTATKIGAFTAAGAIDFNDQNMTKVDINSGTVDGVTIGTNAAVTDLRVDNLKLDSNTLSSINTNGTIALAPHGSGTIQLDSTIVIIGDVNANATLTTKGTGDLTLNTNSGTNSGSIIIADGADGAIDITPNGSGDVNITNVDIDSGAIDGVTIGTNAVVTDLRVDDLQINAATIATLASNANITLSPHGTGNVQLITDAVRIGDVNEDVTLSTSGTGDLTLSTNMGTNSGSIVIYDGANGNISFTPNGSGEVDISKVDIDSGAIDGVTIGTNSVVTDLRVDDLQIDGRTISTLASNLPITLLPHGIGDVQLMTDQVQIGDSNADATLTTLGTGDLILHTNAGSNSGVIRIYDGANGNISITPNGAGIISIPNPAKVGIGTTAADGILHLDNGTVNTYMVLEKDADTAAGFLFHEAGNEKASIVYGADQHLLIKHDESDMDIIFTVNDGGSSTEMMRIDADVARVGIGTATPLTTFHVEAGGTASALVKSTGASGSGRVEVQNDQGADSFGRVETFGASISGNLFGITKANRTYVYAGGSSSAGLSIGTETNDIVTIAQNNVEVLRIDTSENFGFNISSFGTNAVKVLGIGAGIAPASSIADMVQMWVADQAGGDARLFLRTESGGTNNLIFGNGEVRSASGGLTLNANGGSSALTLTGTIAISNSLIELTSGLTGSEANDAGIIIERGDSGNNAFMGWDRSADKFVFGTTTATGASTGDLTIAEGTVVAATFEGALSGNASTATSAAIWTTARTLSFTGDVTGSGSVNGSANVATALTIGANAVDSGMVNVNVFTTPSAVDTVDTANDLLLLYDNSATAYKKVTPANLGLAVSTGAAGSIQFSNGSAGFSADASNLFWDDSNNRLGIGTNAPTTTLQVNGVATFESYLDFNLISAPSSPATEDARMYLKQVDANNNAIAVKLQKAGNIVEVEITSPGAICAECGSEDGTRDPIYDFKRGKIVLNLFCGHSYEVDIPQWRRVV